MSEEKKTPSQFRNPHNNTMVRRNPITGKIESVDKPVFDTVIHLNGPSLRTHMTDMICNPDDKYINTVQEGLVDLVEISDTKDAQIHIYMRVMKVGYEVNTPHYIGVEACGNRSYLSMSGFRLTKETIEGFDNLLLYHGERCKFILENNSECIFTWELKQPFRSMNLYIPLESDQTIILKTEEQIKESYYKIKNRAEQDKEIDEYLQNKIYENYKR